MANNTNGKPVAEIRVGRITATIWQNTSTDEGVFYSVHITRLFRRGSNWDRTPAFGRDDLLTVAKVADLANTRIYELQNAIEFRNPQDDAGAASNARNAAAGPLPAAASSVHTSAGRRHAGGSSAGRAARPRAGGVCRGPAGRRPGGPARQGLPAPVRQAQHSPVSPRNRCPSPGRCRSRLPRSPTAPRRAAPRRRPRGATAHVQWRQRRRQQQHER